jgi:tetratricopeptide (TPR) repeat protein
MPGASDQLSGADVGFRYGPFWGERMNLGVVVQNAVSYAKGDTADKLPLQVKLGSSYKVAGPLLLALDMGSNGDINIGTEYALGSFAALRAGIQNFGGFSFGIGLMFRQSMALDLAVVQSPVLGTSQRLSMSYRFGSRPQQGAPARNVEFAAKEYFDNAMGELDRHHYLDASRSLDMALSLDARLGDNGWKSKAKRLKELTLALGLAERNDLVSAYSEETTQSNEAHQAVLALLDSDDELAMLLAHASYGIDTKDIAFRDLLNTFAALTHRNVIRDDIMAPDLLVEKRLVDLSRLVYHRDYENAIRAGRQAVMLNPNHAMAWTRLGSAYFASGNKSEAVAAWRRALDLEPNNEPLRQFMKAQGL